MSMEFYHDIDLLGVNQLLNSRLHNVTNATETTLAGTLGAAEEGLVVYNTDLDVIKTWDGTQFNEIAPAVAGDVIFQGVHSDLTAGGAPATVVSGSQYIMGAAGTIAWTGITVNPNADVQIGDVVLFTSPTEAYVIQRNDVIASETVAGNVILATQAEVNAGTVADEVITPATLAGWASNFQFAKSFFQGGLALPNNTATTVTHNLGLSDPNAFVAQIVNATSDRVVNARIESVDANSFTITARPAVTVDVMVVGY